ncbi:MAG: hypothetical protein AAF601_07305 [Pseudomonadota bacterium]
MAYMLVCTALLVASAEHSHAHSVPVQSPVLSQRHLSMSGQVIAHPAVPRSQQTMSAPGPIMSFAGAASADSVARAQLDGRNFSTAHFQPDAMTTVEKNIQIACKGAL